MHTRKKQRTRESRCMLACSMSLFLRFYVNICVWPGKGVCHALSLQGHSNVSDREVILISTSQGIAVRESVANFSMSFAVFPSSREFISVGVLPSPVPMLSIIQPSPRANGSINASEDAPTMRFTIAPFALIHITTVVFSHTSTVRRASHSLALIPLQSFVANAIKCWV
jgi:hypothetical protein